VDPRGALIASLDTLADVVSRAVSEIPWKQRNSGYIRAQRGGRVR